MLETKYDHKKVESNKYENWKEKGYFKTEDTKDKKEVFIAYQKIQTFLHFFL